MSKQRDSAVPKKILDYLIDQNRPFSANDILNNLQTDCSKTVLGKALDSLVSDGKVTEKTYGKQKVFYVNQDTLGNSNNDDLQAMDSQIKELTDTLAKYEMQIKNFENKLADLGKSLTLDMAQKELKAVRNEIAVLEKKLESIESKSVRHDPNELKTLISKKEMYARQYQRRKRIANNVIDGILEGYPKTKKQLLEELGVEVDNVPLL